MGKNFFEQRKSKNFIFLKEKFFEQRIFVFPKDLKNFQK